MDYSDLIRLASDPEAVASRIPAPAAADRTNPVSREWVRRWTPARAHMAAPDCRCTAGRCPVCN